MSEVLKKLGLGAREAKAILKKKDTLTERELDMLSRLGRCQAREDIAQELGLSKKTVDAHADNLRGKFETTSAGLVRVWCVFCLLGAA